MTLLAQYDAAVMGGEISDDPEQRAALMELERIRTALARPARWWFGRSRPPKGLYLWGGVGRGKSMVMDMFARSLPDQVLRIHFHAFMQKVHAGMKAARAKGASDALAPVAKDLARGLQCLALDEMQITDITDAMIVGRLFEELDKLGIVVVTTSNTAPDDLYKDGLNRALFLPFIDVIKDRMIVHEIVSPTDYRQDRLQGRQVYFHPLGEQATRGLDALWTDLAGGAGKPLQLDVDGRTVELPQMRNGIARASFSQLCEAPLGPADYLKIAQTVKVLIIDDIPQFGIEKRNAAKRFVTLVDALYEAELRLIISAAAPPEDLCLAKGCGPEFTRTVSRLCQMQAEDWGQAALLSSA
ncbi:MAG: cell division protein ZapE [Planktomarina sp.]